MLQKLVETALELCNAETAGVSLLETQSGREVFRWEALTGVFGSQRNNTMPRDASPCGTTIDEDAPQLMYMADRLVPALKAEPRFVEALLIPFHCKGVPIGTVWIVSHTEGRVFDLEDNRLMETLAQFASSAWHLWQAVENAEEMNRRKDEFMAVLGHELRNPLTAMFGATQILRMLDDGSHPQTKQAMEILTRQTQSLSVLVGELLDISRINTGKFELQKRDIELRPIVSQAVEAIQSEITQRQHKLTVVFSPDNISIHADPFRLVQMLTNLLGNAAKYTPDRGQIFLSVESLDQQVIISVRDTGIGLTADKLTAVFELFTQLNVSSAERQYRGLGLGLKLVQTLAELHGGSVMATSAGPGQGCEFIIRLPIRTVKA